MKFYPVNVDRTRKQLRSIGAVCTKPMRLMRRATFSKSENPHLDISYIRVRDEGDKITLSLKDYPDASKGYEYQRELMAEVSNFATVRSILKATGLKESAYQETRREEWVIDDTLVTIDLWPGLKPYIEVESPSEAALFKIVKRLGYAKEDGERGGALRLYAREYGITFEQGVSLFHGGAFSHLTFRRYPAGTRLKIKP